jgi:hypothetical protein
VQSKLRAIRAVVLSGACVASLSACRSRAVDAAGVVDGSASDAASRSPSIGVAAPPSDASFLHMNSVPGSSVTLDDKPVGPTPIERLQVTPGKHVVVFELADKSAKRTVAVDVPAGATKAVIVRLRD